MEPELPLIFSQGIFLYKIMLNWIIIN